MAPLGVRRVEELVAVVRDESDDRLPPEARLAMTTVADQLDDLQRRLCDLERAILRWHRQNVNPMLVLRNAVCNHEWKQTWHSLHAQRHGVRTKRRQATSQQRLECAMWFLATWGVRIYRLSHPSPPAPPTRPGSGYSWRKPFLRRLPTPTATVEIGAK